MLELGHAKSSVLLVDDTPANLRLLTQILSEQGYKVRVATDGERALTSVNLNPPDLIMLDVMMPKMTGYEVCTRLKLDESARDIPIIFISALTTTEDKVKAFEVGGVDYITKPFQAQEILARVATHIALREFQQSLQQELEERERLIAELDGMNAKLQYEVAERERAELALQLSREHFRTVADFTYNWEYWMGEGGYPVYISPSSERITGYRREEFQKDPGLLIAVVHPDERAMWINHLNNDLTSQDVISFNFRIVTRDGEERWLGHSCQPVYHKDGSWAGRRASSRDITDQVHAEEQLRHYATDLEAQNAELDAFAHTVAHDLKNPLAALLGFSQLLGGRSGRISPDQLSEGLGYISQNARKMANIVDELLLLASVRKLETIQIMPLDMARVVAEAQERLANMLAEHQVELIVPGAWPVALGYAPWIEEVWVNYLSNAIKYGGRPDEGVPPQIELGFDKKGSALTSGSPTRLPDPSYICFWVKDNGPGLTEEEQSELFTQFTRLHQVRIEGYGLGLSIVRRIIEKLGGEVGVESEIGVGSLFWFTLPAQQLD